MWNKIRKSGVLYVFPALLVISIVMIAPLIYTIIMSFFENTLYMDKPKFIGIGQYIKLFEDDTFIYSIGRTVIWTVGSVVFQFLIGFICAILLNMYFIKGKTGLRILLMVPWILPSVIGATIWEWMYNADYGIINYILMSLNLINSNKTWLSSGDTAMYAVIAVNVWKMFPFVLLMVEAALQGVSKQLKEAAIIDGANNIDIFKNVTWPSISPTCYSVLLLMTIWTLNAFTFIYVLTEGGPANRTEVLAMYIQQKAFSEFNFGIASAGSTVLFLISMFVAFVYINITTEKKEDM